MTDNAFVPLPANYTLGDGRVVPTGSARLADGTIRLPDGTVMPGVVIPEVVVHQVPVTRTVQVEENPVVVQSVQAVPQPVVAQPVVAQPVVRQVVAPVAPAPRPVVTYAPEPEPSFWSKWWWLPLLALLGLGLVAWHSCRNVPMAPVTHTETVHITETIHVTAEPQAGGETVGERIEADALHIGTAAETHVRDYIHDLVPDIERDGDELLTGVKHVCAAVLNGEAHAASDIANWFHIDTNLIDEGIAGRIVNYVETGEGRSWCTH